VQDPEPRRPRGRSPGRAILVYDGDCPFCGAYVKRLRVESALGPLELVDARDGGAIVDEIRARGYNLDEGMALLLGDRCYHGDECLHRLALMSTRYGWLNRVNAWLFSNRRLSRIAYPALRSGRNLSLRLLGRGRIASSHPGAR
jgi:predicted DCC family thiol-disulfide oxidoreductase YuxK